MSKQDILAKAQARKRETAKKWSPRLAAIHPSDPFMANRTYSRVMAGIVTRDMLKKPTENLEIVAANDKGMG